MLAAGDVRLRPLREVDLAAAYDAHVDIDNRGRYFPRGVVSEPRFRSRFAETGYWEADEGTLLIWVGADGADGAEEMAGHIEFFPPVGYWDAYELSYQLYDDRYAGRGLVTTAVQLVVDHLFATKKKHRIQLVIVPENAASRRIAEKCGFVLEGTIRGAFYNDGRNHDVVMYSLLRTDPRPWRDEDDRAAPAG